MIKKISIVLILVIVLSTITPVADALTDNQLFILNGHAISKTATVNEVNSVFGNPKITTESAFGGYAYSYYDDNLSWYLSIETNEAGKIVAYGCVYGNFVGKRYSYGDKHLNTYGYMTGTGIYDSYNNDKVYGIYDYNCTTEDVKTYWNNYRNNSSFYLYNLQKHTTIVSKIIAKKNGDPFEHEAISEDIFYMNEQLKYNNSDLYEWAANNGKDKSINEIHWFRTDFYADLPNPVKYAEQTANYTYGSNYKYVLYDLEITNYDSSPVTCIQKMMYIDPTFLDERKEVELTSDEKERLNATIAMNNEYVKYVNAYNSNPNRVYFTEQPNWTTTPLTAGKIDTTLLNGVTAWLNVARVGLGMHTLTLDPTIADYAQHKAVMVYYASNNHLDSGHEMEKPEGVTQDFYNKAQSCMNENLFTGDIQTSISFALNDGYGDPISCGHRYNLLYPGYTSWGTGSAGEGISFTKQSCHKFSGWTDFDNELVAWPSNGIFPMNIAYVGIGNWTAQFYKNYTVSKDTTVTIKCLNTGKTYEINNTNKNETGKLLETTGNTLLTFRDDNIIYEDGDVFEITLHNVTKTSTNQKTDYTYRSVFQQFSTKERIDTTGIQLNKSTYTVAIGQQQRILAKTVPEDSTNKLMKFSSSDEGTVKVRQDGTVTGLKKGSAIITIKCGDITKQVTVNVTDVLLGDVNFDGKVNTDDARLVLLNYVEKEHFTDAQKTAGDVTGDGKVNTDDARQILLYYVEKIEHF